MRKQITWWLLAGLLVPGVARAQGQGENRSAGQTVTPCYRPDFFPVDQWNRQTEEMKQWTCKVVASEPLLQKTYAPPVPSPTRIRSAGLGIAGVLVAAAGIGAVLHFGEDTKNVLGSQYCVSDYGDVDYGACGSPMQTKVGLILIASGVSMAFIGLHEVQVSPMIGPNVKGAKARIQWGGKR